jgi:uncharacterized protein YceK
MRIFCELMAKIMIGTVALVAMSGCASNANDEIYQSGYETSANGAESGLEMSTGHMYSGSN